MAIGAIFEANISQEEYERVLNQVMPGNQPAAGLLYHVAGKGENGCYVVEVWESQEALQRFFDEKLGRALQEANIAAQPKLFEVYNTIQS